jgi:hypothetical protein
MTPALGSNSDVPDALVLPPDGSWSAPVEEYLRFLPLPNEGVSRTELVLHGCQLVEDELERVLENERVNRIPQSFYQRIELARKTIADPDRESLWIALHQIRELRNAVVHEMKNEELIVELQQTFVLFVEEFLKLDGSKVFPEEQRWTFMLYIGLSLVWESLCRQRGAPDTFSVVRPILTNHATAMLRALQAQGYMLDYGPS